ncbi:MAG: OprO/OprP family phosphate-selective porin [Planctomycetales bacterium]|nr:OprO/OprP family phosphate-selective porin [Planctomycetales bacterium]
MHGMGAWEVAARFSYIDLSDGTIRGGIIPKCHWGELVPPDGFMFTPSDAITARRRTNRTAALSSSQLPTIQLDAHVGIGAGQAADDLRSLEWGALVPVVAAENLDFRNKSQKSINKEVCAKMTFVKGYGIWRPIML